MSPPFLSVIIPSYNRPTSTHAAVESVMSQDVDCEIIVVDDSSDEPNALTHQLSGEPRIRLIRRHYNGGAGAARNTGLAHASGDIVTFLDSDDSLLPGSLAARLEQASSIGFGHQGSPIIHACGWQEMGGNSRRRFPRPSASARDFFSACWFAPGSAILARTELFRGLDGGFDEQLRRLEDFDVFARLAVGGLVLISQPVLGVLLDATYSAKVADIFDATTKLETKFADMHKHDIIGISELNSAKAYLAYERAAAYSRSGRKVRALAALVTSLMHKPRRRLLTGPGWDDTPASIGL